MSLQDALKQRDLDRLAAPLAAHVLPSAAFWFSRRGADRCSSKLGGEPDLPADFVWQTRNGRKLDFLLQIRTDDVRAVYPSAELPVASLLSFFYDLDEQPWGYDPKNLGGFHVALSTLSDLRATPLPNREFELEEWQLQFVAGETVPHPGSRSFEDFSAEVELTDREFEQYFEFCVEFENTFYPRESGLHRLFGHSANVQGDLQLEAQLVSHGLYCGDESGYKDPRRSQLEEGTASWKLLLQLDSDEPANLMWGDLGMLYFLLRETDLSARQFDRTWMTLQCG